MCMEDIRIGRIKSAAASIVTLPATGVVTPILKQSNERTHIWIQPVNTQQGFIAPKGITPSVNAGLPLMQSYLDATVPYLVENGPIEFDIEEHGLVTTWEWNGSATGGQAVILMVIETFLEAY